MSNLVLPRCPLFRNIAPEEWNAMVGCLKAREATFPKGGFLPVSEESVPLMGVVLEGSVSMLSEERNGKRSLITILLPDQLFGETYACARAKNRVITYQAREDCRVLLMDYDRVLHSCNVTCAFHHRLVENMVELIAAKNLELTEKIEAVSCTTIREKVLTYLRRLSENQDSPRVRVPYSRGELADYLCVDRSAMTRELSRMREAGLLAYQKRDFVLLDE